MGRNITLSDQGTLVLKELASNGTDSVTVQAPASLAASYTLTLPTTDGGANEFLQTDGSGGLTWATSTATLDSAYENGATITADAGQVEINGNGNVGLFLNQDSDHAALSIDSEATGSPLLLLAPVVGNTRGDIAFGTARTSDASSPSEGDLWYNSTDKNLYIYDGTGNVDLTQQNTDTQNTLDEAYDEGGAGSGRTITADSGSVQITSSAQVVLDLDQAGDFGGATITKTGTGAGVVLDLEDDGTGGCANLNQDGNGVALSIDSEATSQPLINLAPVTGNTRGDIAFSTARTAVPSSPSEGDIWYNATLDRFQIQMAANQTIKSPYGPAFGPLGSQTISGGVITVTTGYTEIEAQGAPGSDDLDTINSSPQAQVGDTILITCDFASGSTIVVKHNTGNIQMAGAADRTLSNGLDSVLLVWNGNDWIEMNKEIS